jgi:hypothetical protein
MSELARFAEKWCHPEHTPETVDGSGLSKVEKVFGIQLPFDYLTQVRLVGLPSPTLALLSAIVDLELDLHDLSELYDPEEIIGETKDWRAISMPASLIAIGSDGSGNKFCFDERQLKGGRKTHAPVFFWDHDLDEIEQVAVSFSSWIESYLGSWSQRRTALDF